MKIKLTEEQYISIIKEQNVGIKKIIKILSSTPKISVPNIHIPKKIKLTAILKSNDIEYMKNQLSSLYKNVGTDNLKLKNMLLQANIKPRDVGGIIEQINIAEKYILLALHRGMKAEDLALKLGTGWKKQDVKNMVDLVYGKNIAIYDKLGIFKDKLTTRTDTPQSIFGKTKKDVVDHYRFKKFTDLEKKIFTYIKGYNKTDKRLKPHVGSFRKYYGDHISGKRAVDEKLLTDDEILKFLTKHYYEDILPNLKGIYKNKVLVHGSSDMMTLDIIDISTHLGNNTRNKGLLGSGFYLTASPKTGQHYGDIQPFVINNVKKPLYLRKGTKNYYGYHDYEGYDLQGFFNKTKLEEVLDEVSLEKINAYRNKYAHDRPFFQVVSASPELDAAWKQNMYKVVKNNFKEHLKNAGVDDLSINKALKTIDYKLQESSEFANLAGDSPMMADLYKRGGYDLIVSPTNTAGTGGSGVSSAGPNIFMDAEVILKQDKAKDLISLFPSVDLIKNMEGNSISRNIGSENIHLESTGRKIKLNESQYKKILLREFGETVTDPKEWYRRVLEWVDSPNDLDFEANQYEVVAYDDKGAYLGYYDKGQGFGFVVTEYGIGLEDEEEIIDEDEEGETSGGGSMTKWEDLVSPVRGPDNTLDNSPWSVSPERGPDNTLDNSPWDVSPVRGPDNQLT